MLTALFYEVQQWLRFGNSDWNKGSDEKQIISDQAPIFITFVSYDTNIFIIKIINIIVRCACR